MGNAEGEKSTKQKLLEYIADDNGRLINRDTVAVGLAIPALTLAGHLLIGDSMQQENQWINENEIDYRILVDPEEGSATHARVSVEYVERELTNPTSSFAIVKRNRNTIPVGSEAQCLSEGKKIISQRVDGIKTKSATIDCLKDGRSIGQYFCFASQASPLSSKDNTDVVSCQKSAILVLGEQDSDNSLPLEIS